MKKFVISIAVMSIITCMAEPLEEIISQQEELLAEDPQCTPTNTNGTPQCALTVNVIPNIGLKPTCTRGSFIVTIKNNTTSTISGSSVVISATGPQSFTISFTMQSLAPGTSIQRLAPLLLPGTYSVTTTINGGCIFNCSNIVVTNKKCAFLPFLCCRK